MSPASDYIEQYTISYHGLNADTAARNVTVGSSTETTTLEGLQSGDTYAIIVAAVSGGERGVSVEARKTTSMSNEFCILDVRVVFY